MKLHISLRVTRLLPHGHGVTCILVSLAPEGELKTVEDETETTLEVALFTFHSITIYKLGLK